LWENLRSVDVFPQKYRHFLHVHSSWKSWPHEVWESDNSDSVYTKKLTKSVKILYLHVEVVMYNIFSCPSYCIIFQFLTPLLLMWLIIQGGCPRRNVPDFGRVFLMLKYTDIAQNTYVQSWTVTEIMAREKCGLLAGPRTVPVTWQSYRVRPWFWFHISFV
jgi:hypothetical protein